ncbi:MAG TPA: selenocysteine-specific translation elongation factor [Candidatus Marinimicrobia bacterium]|nr:selenocysteine-specific translation elongation factor [Candidatus Neomarinimicrobiota bacterium]
MSQIVIGTAGHIDHGKTALVKALTGTDTDSLPEEQRRGMTIDLGFAFLTDNITIIDVPGHEKFIRNMVAGVSTVDIALLTIATDDGIMPQTREHLDILRLLNIRLGCVALTKCDLSESEDWLDLLEEEISDFVKDTFQDDIPIVRTSAETGDGVDDLRTVLTDLAGSASERNDRGFFRQSVDRVFSMKGFGTVVTGTVSSGRVEVGNTIEIVPGGIKAKIRGLQSHGKDVKSVKPGDRSAVNLSGVERHHLKRGSQIVSIGFLEPLTSFGAEIKLTSSTKRKLKHEQRIRIHLGTDEVMGRVLIAGSDRKKSISQGESATVLIRLEKPIPVAMGDQLIIRLYSPPETLGGGTVIDTQLPRKWKAAAKWLSELSDLPVENRTALFLERNESNPKTVSEWGKRFQLGETELKSQLDGLELVRFGDGRNPFLSLSHLVEKQMSDMMKAVGEFHEKAAYRLGIPRDELRQNLEYSEPLFDYLTDLLVKDGQIELKDGLIQSGSHKIKLSESDRKLAQKVSNTLQKFSTTPPLLSELATELGQSDKKTLELLHVLKSEGKVTEITRNLWYLSNVLMEMETSVRNFLVDHKGMAVTDFKKLTGTTRKHAIPLLEYLDKHDVTFRDGDKRVLA